MTTNGVLYAPRVLQHNVFELQASSDQGVDGVPRISLMLAKTALKGTNVDFVSFAMICASVVLPTPGGPHRIIEGT